MDIKEFKEALLKDFNELYTDKFTLDYEAKRIIREMEIEVMDFNNVKQLFKKV